LDHILRTKHTVYALCIYSSKYSQYIYALYIQYTVCTILYIQYTLQSMLNTVDCIKSLD